MCPRDPRLRVAATLLLVPREFLTGPSLGSLYGLNRRRLEALISLLNNECNPLAFIKPLEALLL